MDLASKYPPGVHDVPVSALRLDAMNPRFRDRTETQLSQVDLAVKMDDAYDCIQVAESINRNGFFLSEPLIATVEGNEIVVIEGNRRLTALQGLLDASLREKFAKSNPKWKSLVPKEPGITVVPVVLVATRQEVFPLLGFRHISGLAEWEPYSQARYVVELIDQQGVDFDDLASQIGRSPTVVRAQYRNYMVVDQAESEFELDVEGPRNKFGVWTAAMGRRPLYGYIGAPPPREVRTDEWPIDPGDRDRVENLFAMLFGLDGRGPVISDSRELKALADVVSHDPEGSVERLLADGGPSLRQVLLEIGGPLDPELTCAEAVGALERLQTASLYRASSQFAKELDDALAAVLRIQVLLVQLVNEPDGDE